MHRIDTSTAQKDKFGPGKNGFTEGSPQTGVPPTALNAAFFDSVQEEISAVIEGAGIELDPEQNNQLMTAIKSILSDGVDGQYLPLTGGTITSESSDSAATTLKITGTQYAPVVIARPDSTDNLAYGFVLSDGTVYYLGTNAQHKLYWGTEPNAQANPEVMTSLGGEITGPLQVDKELTASNLVTLKAPDGAARDIMFHRFMAEDGVTENLDFYDADGWLFSIHRNTSTGVISTTTNGPVFDDSGRVYSPGNLPPATDLSGYYTKTESDARYLTEASGITGIRLANYGSVGKDGVHDSQQVVLTGIYDTNGWDNPTTQEFRQVQFEIAGQWYNAPYV